MSSSFNVLLMENPEMARKRHQSGYLIVHHGSWLLRWREYVRDDQGETVPVNRSEVLGATTGPNRLTKKQAEQARDDKMAEVNAKNQRPSAGMTVQTFAEGKFQLGHVDTLKPSGKKHYAYCLRKILPRIGKMRLCDVEPEHIESIVFWARGKGFSDETVKKLRDVCSAMFEYARDQRLYKEQNPARAVRLPEPSREKRPTYSVDQIRLILQHLRSPYREIAYLAVVASVNIAEATGIKQRFLNLSDESVYVEGMLLAPRSVAIVANRYEGQQGSLKSGKRRRVIALDATTCDLLRALKPERTGPDEAVFQGKGGIAINGHNATNRVLRPLGKKLGFPVNWHGFRRSHSSLVGGLAAVPVEDRVRTMGHAEAEMTMYYSIEDQERRRAITEGVSRAIWPDGGGKVQ